MPERLTTTQSPKEEVQRESVFDGGTFDIPVMCEDPTGLQIRTIESKPRDLARHREYVADNRAGYQIIVKGEKARNVAERKKAGDEGRLPRMPVPKVGLRDIHLDGDTLMCTIQPVPYTAYLAFRSPDTPTEDLAFANPTGTAGILLSTEPDGSHKMIVQHRSRKNRLYADIPGASAAGMLDGELYDRRRLGISAHVGHFFRKWLRTMGLPLYQDNPQTREQRGCLKPIDTASIVGNFTKELQEELGVSPEDLTQARITGLSRDKVSVHNELLLSATSSLNAAEIKEKAENNARERHPDDQYDFEESCLVLDATPQTIEKLLTEVCCPLPSTHAAAFVTAGYLMILEQQGKDVAEDWKRSLQEKVRDNYARIDALVAAHWEHYPEMAKMSKENRLRSTVKGYDPSYQPTEQGLPNLMQELQRVELQPSEQKERSEVEAERRQAYLFDVDGVLTDPSLKKIKYVEILDSIIALLSRGESVCANTGRAVGFVERELLARIRERATETGLENEKIQHMLQHVSIIGEKGGTWYIPNKEGEFERYINYKLQTEELKKMQNEVRELVKKETYAPYVVFDDEKKTMISLEMRDGVDIVEFQNIQPKLAEKLRKLLHVHNLQDTFKVDETRIAIDVESKEVGKGLGARQYREILRSRGITPTQYYAFGDSRSDIEMAEALNESGDRVRFIYAGTPEDLAEDDFKFQVVHTETPIDDGVKSWLTAHLKGDKHNK